MLTPTLPTAAGLRPQRRRQRGPGERRRSTTAPEHLPLDHRLSTRARRASAISLQRHRLKLILNMGKSESIGQVPGVGHLRHDSGRACQDLRRQQQRWHDTCRVHPHRPHRQRQRRLQFTARSTPVSGQYVLIWFTKLRRLRPRWAKFQRPMCSTSPYGDRPDGQLAEVGSSRPDAELLRRHIDGDTDAFGAVLFIRRHGAPLGGAAVRTIGRPQKRPPMRSRTR